MNCDMPRVCPDDFLFELPSHHPLSPHVPQDVERRFWQQKMAECGKMPSLRLDEEDEDASAAGSAKAASSREKMLSWIPMAMTVGQHGDATMVAEHVMTVKGDIVPINRTVAVRPPGTTEDVELPMDDVEQCEVKRHYELFGAVFHIRDAKSCGSLVAVVKVGG